MSKKLIYLSLFFLCCQKNVFSMDRLNNNNFASPRARVSYDTTNCLKCKGELKKINSTNAVCQNCKQRHRSAIPFGGLLHENHVINKNFDSRNSILFVTIVGLIVFLTRIDFF